MSSSPNELFKNFIKKRLPKIVSLNFVVIVSVTFVVGMSSGYYYRMRVINQQKYLENELSTRAFKVIFGGKNLGYVRDQELVSKTIEILQTKISEQQGIDVVIKDDVQFLTTHAEDNQILSVKDLALGIKSNLTYNVNAYAVKVNGEVLAILESEESANKIISDIKAPYINRIENEKSNLEDIKLLEKIDIVKTEVPISKVEDYDRALAILQRGTDEEKIHKVEKGESFWSISKKYNIDIDDLTVANPDKDPSLIRPGDELSLIVPKPYLTVVTYEEKTYIEKIKYDTVYKNTSTLYKDQTRVQKNGIYGEKQVVAKLEKYNGVEASREVLSENVISNPSSKIVLKGTKAIPAMLGIGIFRVPTNGRLTSPFGYRWGGKFHHGIDLAVRVGTPIKAADGGKVIFSGWKYPYGYLVIIDHGGGFTTRYGHNSKLYVKAGDKVAPRETIAASGNTGVSTGPHVHFEVRKYGVAQNPYSYLDKRYR